MHKLQYEHYCTTEITNAPIQLRRRCLPFCGKSALFVRRSRTVSDRTAAFLKKSSIT